MSCTTCSYTKNVPTCVSALVIGAIDDTDADVYVFIKNIATGRLDRLEGTSDGNGIVTVSSIPTNYFMDKNDYEVWVTLRTVSQNARETITIDGDDDTCWALPFLDMYGSDGEKETHLSITLESNV